jgi:hypothetical protein
VAKVKGLRSQGMGVWCGTQIDEVFSGFNLEVFNTNLTGQTWADHQGC